MKHETKYLVLERWNLDCMDSDANVFNTLEEAKAYADYQAEQMADYIKGGTIKHGSEENSMWGCYVYVDDDDNLMEWWEARILERGVINMKEFRDGKQQKTYKEI